MTARILLAEDNANLSGLLRKFLETQGFAVLTAKSGLEALQLFAAETVDLLVLDLRLPVVSGIEVLQKIRRAPKGAGLPVVIMTGVYKGERFVAGARRLGVRHYLEKPFRPQDFLQSIRTALAEANMAPTMLELLADIFRKRQSGLLSIGEGSPVVFLKGEPCTFLSRGREDFPSFLAARGRIGTEERGLFVSGNEGRLFFTQAGLLTYEELVEESRLFLSRRLMESLDGSAPGAFTEEAPQVEFPLIPLSLPRFLYEAAKSRPHHFDPEAFLRRYAPLYPARTVEFFRLANLISMRREDIGLLARMDGRISLRDILAGADEHAAADFFHFLLSLGMVHFHPAPAQEAGPGFPVRNLFNRPLEEVQGADTPTVDFEDFVEEVAGSVELAVETGMDLPLSTEEIGIEQEVIRDFAQLKGRNYYEILGLTPQTFSFSALKEAYFARTRRYSPERFMELPGNVQETAQEILSVYAHAYGTLSSVVAKERYDELLNADKVGLGGKQDDRLQAQVQFQSGKVFLEMGEFDNAEKALQDAYTLEPENALHCAWLAWAIYRNPTNRNSRAALEKARSLLSKSLRYGKNAEAFSFRGWMLLDEGRDGLAEGEFQKALRLNPNEMHAHKGLRQITEKREAEKKGIFRKIFG